MALSNLDRDLLQSCLAGRSEAWAELTDRFLGLIIHVVNHTAEARNIQITPESRDDLVAEVFLSWIERDFAALRRFRGNSSLATYLTVIARRVVTRRLSQLRIPHPTFQTNNAEQIALVVSPDSRHVQTHDSFDEEEFEQLVSRLTSEEAIAIRMFHIESKSYDEISQRLGMPINSVGPFLSRAREKMRAANPRVGQHS